MDVRCDKCGTEYEFDDARIGGHGVTVKCTNCGFVFKVHKEASRASRDWLVRKADDQIIAFRQLTTLQKWIVEGRIDRKDEISRNGETWKRLGNIGELEPFFSVFDKAQALNDLMSTGSIGARPVVVNGSEILATMNPLAPAASLAPPAPAAPPALIDVPLIDPHSLPPEPIAAAITKPSSPRRVSSVRGSARNVARGPALLSRPPGPPEVPLAEPPTPSTTTSTPRAAMDLAATLVDGDPSSRATEPPPPPAPRPPPPTATPSRQNGVARHLHSAPPPTTGLAGPGALRSDLTADLALPTEAESKRAREGSEIVRNFRREQRNRRMLMATAGLLMIGLGGGAAFAMLGPEKDNPLRAVLESYGIIPGQAPKDDTAEKLELAYRDFELDTEESLTRADQALGEIADKRPAEPSLRADRALVLMTRADALRRAAARKDEQLREHRMLLQQHEEEVKRRAALAEHGGDAAKIPKPPDPIDQAALEAGARADREKASALLKSAFDLARQAHVIAPNGLATSRALAEYYRVQRDQQGLSAKHLEAAKQAARASGTGDAATKYIEAASLVGTGKDVPPSSLLTATNLLEEALTMRPTMVRARVLLARVLILRQQNDLAKAELDKVAKIAPAHAEVPLLLADLEKRRAPEKTPEKAPAPPPLPLAVEKVVVVEPDPKAVAEKEKLGPKKPATTKSSGPKISDLAAEDAESKPYQDWIALGDRLRRGGDAKGALAAYEKAADRRLNAPQAYAGMGWSYLDQGKTVAALNAFKKALTINSRFPEGHLGKGVAFRKLGRREDAMEAYRAYLNLAPNGNEAVAARHTLEQLEAEERAAQAAVKAATSGTSE